MRGVQAEHGREPAHPTQPASRHTTCCASRPIVVCMRIASVASAANAGKSTMCARLALPNVPLEWLAQALKDMARARRPRIQAQDTVVRQRHLPRHGHLAAPKHTHLGDGVKPGTIRARAADGGAVAHEGADRHGACSLLGAHLRPAHGHHPGPCSSRVIAQLDHRPSGPWRPGVNPDRPLVQPTEAHSSPPLAAMTPPRPRGPPVPRDAAPLPPAPPSPHRYR
jgi:hypothetical protein